MLIVAGPFSFAQAQHKITAPGDTRTYVAPASDEGQLAIKKFQVYPGLKVDLWAAEPLLANPVSFTFDEKGRVYVCETFRHGAGVDDIRSIMERLDEELAARTVNDRLLEMKRHLGDKFASYSEVSERIRLIEDRDGDGRADHATVFAEGFNSPLDGIGAGVLARKGSVWYAEIPNLWLLRDTNNDGVADSRKSLHYGFGVRVGFLGHDLHGLHFGPDGKLYFSIGDRGSNVRLPSGRSIGEPDTGCVFRCNPDGSDLEVFAYGLRNPQDLVFDQYGNLFTGDNNSDSGDKARWVWLVEGGDSGWRVGYQFLENPYSRGPFNAEKLWYPHFKGQAAFIMPPIANISDGPSGVTYFPGTGLPESFREHFFLTDFRGGDTRSGVHTFTLERKGAGFELVNEEHFIWNVLPTDVRFGVDGGLYLTDWVEGWGKPGKGRIYRVHDPALDRDPLVIETKRLLAEGMEQRSLKELEQLLAHQDMRVRQEAQFELADRGSKAIETLITVARGNRHQLARLHAVWALGQILSKACRASDGGQKIAPINAELDAKSRTRATDCLIGLLADSDAEVRAQSAKVLGDCRCLQASDALIKLTGDPQPRTRFFAAMSLGKLGQREGLPAILDLLRDNADRDPYIRHAAVMALTWIGDQDALLAAAGDQSRSVRMGVLLALRRLHRAEIIRFLKDRDPMLVLEAARAINDEPINGAMPELAALIMDQPTGVDEALLRRVLNANFRVGTPECARALGEFAGGAAVAENLRGEALEELGQWANPSGRDRVLGLWLPVVGERRREAAVVALEPHLAEILKSAPTAVCLAALESVGKLAMTNTVQLLSDLAANTNRPGLIRAGALKTLAALGGPGLDEALKVAETDPDEDVRKEATLLTALSRLSDAVTRLVSILDKGSRREKQAALAALGALPDPAADEIILQWLDRLISGDVPKTLQLDLIDAAGKRSAAPVKEKLSKYHASKKIDDPLAEYRETLFGGNKAEGKAIFFGRPEAQCVRCHKIGGQGGDVGPDLSHIGSQKEREYLLESIVLPNKQIAQGFESVMVVMKNGDSNAGVLKNETPDQIVINSPENGVMTIRKSDIESRRKSLSPMPEGIGQILSKRDVWNLIEFLSSLK